MGEIADALRRARGTTPPEIRPVAPVAPPPPEPSLGRLPAAPTLAAREPAPERPAGNVITRIDPPDHAIALEGAQAEACRRVALRARAHLKSAKARSLAVVSAGRADGKTTVACNIALAFASLIKGRQVALVDLDLRKPSVAPTLGLRPQHGIEEVLHGRANLADVQISLSDPEIDFFPAIQATSRSHELLVQPRFAQLIEQLERRYEVVVIDTPPVLLTPDANLILEHVAMCVPIARVGWTRLRSFRALVEALPRSKMIDPLLNGGSAPGHYGVDDYYGVADVPDAPPPLLDWGTLKKRWGNRGE